jgi:hypothetical protein
MFRVENHLCEPVAVAHVAEVEAAVVAAPVDPTADLHLGARIGVAEFSA